MPSNVTKINIEFKKCGKIIKTIENIKLPCLRPTGHKGGCNPFSNTPSPTG